MNNNLEEILEKYYEPACEDNWYVCRECGVKLFASEKRAEDLALHELQEHPNR